MSKEDHKCLENANAFPEVLMPRESTEYSCLENASEEVLMPRESTEYSCLENAPEEVLTPSDQSTTSSTDINEPVTETDSSCTTPEHIHIDMTSNDSFEDVSSATSLETITLSPTVSIDQSIFVSHVPVISSTPETSSAPVISSVQETNPIISQDTSQKIGVATTVVVEIYRALIASFLILFVPQSCGNHVCSFSENAQTGSDPLYNAGFAFNCITMAAFIALYYAEVRRESKLIAYLDVNAGKPSDNESVGHILEKLPDYCSKAILYYDGLYTKAGYTVIVCFAVNTVLSGLVVYKYYLDDKTTTTYITSVLFVIQKLIQVYATLKTEKNVFYSAYLSGKIQYNDVDPDKELTPDKELIPPIVPGLASNDDAILAIA